MSVGQSPLRNLLLFIVFFTPLSAQASERLDFSGNLGERSRRIVEKYAAEHIKIDIQALKIARADLNEDGLDEYILKTPACESISQRCTFEVLAEINDTIIEIGEFSARTVMLGNGYSAGIRNIVAFTDKTNDFDYELYVWEPQQSRYILSK